MKYDLSLVIPTYNEEPHLLQSIRDITQILNFTKINYEIIFVDDCSKDKTVSILEKTISENQNYSLLKHEVNKGHGQAVIDGIQASQGTVVGFLDVDLEVSPIYLVKMFYSIYHDGYDVASAYRIYEFFPNIYSMIRDTLSVGYRFAFRTIIGLPIKDTETGYKFFRRDKIIPVLKYANDPGWFWDTEIMVFSHLAGLKIKEVSCLFVRRLQKKSSIKWLPYTIKHLKALLTFRIRLKKFLKTEKQFLSEAYK